MTTSCSNRIAHDCRLIVTVEEGTIVNGFGAMLARELQLSHPEVRVVCLGVPDRLMEQAPRAEQLERMGLTGPESPRGLPRFITRRASKRDERRCRRQPPLSRARGHPPRDGRTRSRPRHRALSEPAMEPYWPRHLPDVASAPSLDALVTLGGDGTSSGVRGSSRAPRCRSSA
jgi:hypothetical protein